MSTAVGTWPAAPPAAGVGDVLDLADVPVLDREARLEEMVSATHVDMAVRLGPDWPAASFRSRLRQRRIEDLLLVDVRCDPCSGMRGQHRAARTASLYLGVTVARGGRETAVAGDAVADLRPGNVLVWRSDQPARFRVHEPQVKQTLIVPLAALADVSEGAGLFRAVALDGAAPAVQLLTGYLDILSRTAGQLTAPELSAARRAALELLAAAMAARTAEAAAPPLAVMQAWIEQRLQAGEVTPAAIAAAHAMSVRSVYRVFEEAGETVGGFVRARRLERARRDLAAGADSISQIAVRWGFSDASHFARAFRAQYGCPPRDYRLGAAARP
jgi:AraC family transcriptional regulator, positive regulator of tynA and feaB